MNDLISRQAAIRWVKIECNPYGNPTLDYDSGIKVIEHLKQMPAAEPVVPDRAIGGTTLEESVKALQSVFVDHDLEGYSIEHERKTGRWQITDAYPHNVYCSECHTKFAQTHWAVWEDGSLPRNFCPNCGAEMTEGENETY